MPVGLTLVLSAVPKNRICVTRRTVLGFHEARLIDRRGRFHVDPEATEIMYETYPTAVRGWIHRRGGLTSHLLPLRGRDLTGFIEFADESTGIVASGQLILADNQTKPKPKRTSRPRQKSS
jgi:hypothetical protein